MRRLVHSTRQPPTVAASTESYSAELRDEWGALVSWGVRIGLYVVHADPAETERESSERFL